SWNMRSSSSYGFIYGFQGARLDTTSGLDYERNRDLSPNLGRWIQTDPIRYLGGDSNLYRFEKNNPDARLDPMGLKDCDTCKATTPNPYADGTALTNRQHAQYLKKLIKEAINEE